MLQHSAIKPLLHPVVAFLARDAWLSGLAIFAVQLLCNEKTIAAEVRTSSRSLKDSVAKALH